MPNDCSLASLVDCNDQNATITNLIQQNGYISDYIQAGIVDSDPHIKLFSPTKMPFPSGQGDSLTRAVLESTTPNELDGLGWTPVKSNYPGQSACCNNYRKISYGNRTATGCLTKVGYITDPFCKVDVIFKSNFLEQLMTVVYSMQNTTRGVWSNWLKHSYPTQVLNGMLSNKWGHPEQQGQYPADARPTSAPTVEGFEVFKERIDSVGGPLGSPLTGYVVYVMGRNAYARMKRRRLEQGATLYGQRQSADFSLPGYNSTHVVGLGTVETWGGMAFVVIDKPRRFREKGPSEDWDDALIPSTINVPTQMGVKAAPNPDYYNADIAIYEESLIVNLQAVDWLTPPDVLAKDITVGGKTFFPALSYAGNFVPFYCPEDPLRKTVRFSAEFMGGMMSRFPDKGRAIMHLAVHIEACDDDDFVCVNNRAGLATTGVPIRWVGTTATATQLNVLVTGTLLTSCPPGNSLFMVTEKGLKYPIASFGTVTPFEGNHEYPQAGSYVLVNFPTGYNAVVNTRELCDPWKFIQCLPNSTPSDDPSIVPCGVCNNSAGVTEECTLEAVITADIIRGITLAGGGTTISVTNYTSAATLQTAINSWLGSNGGGTATVTGGPGLEFNGIWNIKIVGSTALVGASVVYDDGFVNTNTIEFGQSGDCSPTS